MHLSRMRGTRLVVTVLLIAALAGGILFPTLAAAGTTTPTTVPHVAGQLSPTKTATPVVSESPTKAPAKTTTARTTASPPTTTRAPTTVKTTLPPTTSPPAAPTAPSLPAPVAVVTAPTIVVGAYTVPTGTGQFLVTSVGNVPVGGSGVVQLVVDNGWNPLFGDTYIDISWDPAQVEYESAAIKVLNTTAAVSSDHSVRVMLGDFRRGYPQGRYPLASITLRALREGTSTLSVSVDHVRYWNSDFSEFTDITATASARNGVFSTGPLPADTQPLVTFTQNTLAPASYPTDIDAGGASTTQTTRSPTATPTVARSVEATPTPLPTAVVTEQSLPTGQPTAVTNETYGTVVTRVQTSGSPLSSTLLVILAVVGMSVLLSRRYR